MPVAVLDGRRVGGGGPTTHVKHRKLPIVAAGADHAGVLRQHASLQWLQHMGLLPWRASLGWLCSNNEGLSAERLAPSGWLRQPGHGELIHAGSACSSCHHGGHTLRLNARQTSGLAGASSASGRPGLATSQTKLLPGAPAGCAWNSSTEYATATWRAPPQQAAMGAPSCASRF